MSGAGEKIFTKGALLLHIEKEKTGIVIDWGIYNKGNQRYLPSSKELADSLRVWTEGRIELWDKDTVEFLEH